MSLRRIYVDGKPDWLDEGPSFARVQGFGGSMVTARAGYAPGTLAIVTPTAAAGMKRRAARKRDKAKAAK